MSKPVLAVTLLTAMAAAWYWALLPPVPPVTPGVVAGVRVASDQGPRVPTVHLDRLDGRTRQGVLAGEVANPFRRGGSADRRDRGRADTTTARSEARSEPPAAPVAAPPSWPRLDLIGLAEAEEGGRLVRTAILASPAGVQHARPGDVLAGVYRVERVADDAVEVRLLPEDRVLHLSLRR